MHPAKCVGPTGHTVHHLERGLRYIPWYDHAKENQEKTECPGKTVHGGCCEERTHDEADIPER